ncbi:phage Tail Collar domain protein [Proteus vulgaris]|uniref:phage tail-collar fiber domain-containing protein n=1 Tax=Proteus vulgaris TaxID=585 RepID=UPI000507AF01|nr:phage tail protein [Proteus vulgaris]KGA60219.1 phage Tail Collar domain protein [Proteus vulgaris]
MSQSAITLAFERWKASATEAQQPVILDEFVLANVPNLDPSKPIDRSEGLPDAKYIMHRQAVNKVGVVNQNAVAYSVTIGAEIGDFEFNWIGLLNKQSGTVAMIVHAPTQQKIKTQSGQQGNVLTRSFLLEYLGASKETAITTPAEMWQIDFTARLTGIDEMQRLINRDKYGEASFFGDAFLVGKTGNQYFITRGTGYVSGLRAFLATNKNITISNENTKVWVDVSYQGNITSDWDVHITITVKPDLKNYTDNAGFPHFVFAVASISATGVITDLRPKGTLDAQYFDEALKKHEQSRNHPDATTTEKGFTKLANQVDDSQVTSLTPYGAKKELEKYQPKGNYQPAGNYVTTATFNLEINKKIDKANISQQLANDVNKVPSLDLVTKELGGKQPKGNYADKSSSNDQIFTGSVSSLLNISSSSTNSTLALDTTKAYPRLSHRVASGAWREIKIPDRTGEMSLVGDSYTTTQSDGKYQAKGNYADKSSSNDQIFTGSVSSLLNISSSSTNSTLALDTTKAYPRLSHRVASGAWREIKIPDKTGEMSLVGDSYTTTQSDSKYQFKGNYADKSATNVQEFSSNVNIKRELYIANTNNTVGVSLNVLQDEPKIISLHKSGAWKTINIPEKSGTMALVSDIEEANIYPWGVLIPWCGATAPDWALVANGSAFNKTTYSKLAPYFPSGRLPDARANVLRGLDAGRGVDVGRQILSEQMGNSLLSTAIISDPESKGFEVKIKDIGTSGTNNQGWHWLYQQTEGKNGNETRMRNTAVLWIVRAK